MILAQNLTYLVKVSCFSTDWRITTNANISTDTRVVHKSFGDHSLVQTTIVSKCTVDSKCNN